jgi:hypothetical protein
MIIFEFEYETHNLDGTLKDRPIWWLGSTSVTDETDEDEIFEQLEAEQVFNI